MTKERKTKIPFYIYIFALIIGIIIITNNIYQFSDFIHAKQESILIVLLMVGFVTFVIDKMYQYRIV